MEAEVVYVPYDTNIKIDVPSSANPIDSEKTQKAVAKIKKMVTQGWQIISTVPVTGSYSMPTDVDYTYRGVTLNYTTGYEVWLQRETLDAGAELNRALQELMETTN